MQVNTAAEVTTTRSNQESLIVKGKGAIPTLDDDEGERAVPCTNGPQTVEKASEGLDQAGSESASDKTGDSQPCEDQGAAAALVLGKHGRKRARSSSSSNGGDDDDDDDDDDDRNSRDSHADENKGSSAEPRRAMKLKRGRGGWNNGSQKARKRQRRESLADSDETKFFGKYICRSQDEATRFAERAHQYEFPSAQPTEYHVFWTDASVKWPSVGCGAAVVYKEDPQSEDFIHDMYYVHEVGRDIRPGEMFAIGAGLKTAVSRLEKRGQVAATTRQVVLVFNDSQAAMDMLRGKSRAKRPLEAWLVRLVAALSRRLAQMNVKVELHWVKGHVRPTPGHKMADQLAKSIMTHMELGLSDRALVKLKRVDCASLEIS
ncbi:hypothetical protein BO71DRAFT_110641 [Aspergillus ellipticus CBS 707.79]|uniref:RNase H type-1 domain-containing protein n=1 Tax=Aspergillus ellipticus CBS 707.79 TaxID=1448320 RepID=A0A319DMN9_9EURO|nr:hypothetical protein BO71DRAFT_110641 [Aspergillus ellipticus CBS 707.79]